MRYGLSLLGGIFTVAAAAALAPMAQADVDPAGYITCQTFYVVQSHLKAEKEYQRCRARRDRMCAMGSGQTVHEAAPVRTKRRVHSGTNETYEAHQPVLQDASRRNRGVQVHVEYHIDPRDPTSERRVSLRLQEAGRDGALLLPKSRVTLYRPDHGFGVPLHPEHRDSLEHTLALDWPVAGPFGDERAVQFRAICQVTPDSAGNTSE